MFRRFLEITFPYPQHAIAARLHVGVLRLVEGDAAGLAMVKRGEFGGVAMPVVTIELNDKIDRGDKGIYTKLVTNQELAFIRHVKRIEYGVGGALEVVWFHAQLLCVHAAQMYAPLWVFVSALKRAIGDVVSLRPGRRPIEGLAAYLASVFGLVATLPFIRANNRAEAGFVGGSVKRDTAHLAWHIFASLALWSSGAAVTLKRAIVVVGACVPGDCFSATLASDSTNGIFIHTYILTQ